MRHSVEIGDILCGPPSLLMYLALKKTKNCYDYLWFSCNDEGCVELVEAATKYCVELCSKEE